jgi:prepilin-type N-terminal cleavage/methylation domain-containing protein
VTRRGFSLVEMCVVVMIGVVLLFALLPVATGLLRQQAGLNARSLGIDTWPLLVERLGGDAGRSSGALVSPPFPSAAFRLRFPPETAEDPDVTWTFGDGRAERATERRRPDGEVVRATTTWDLPGALQLEPGELESGRLLLEWRDGSGRELVALACGRATEPAR